MQYYFEKKEKKYLEEVNYSFIETSFLKHCVSYTHYNFFGGNTSHRQETTSERIPDPFCGIQGRAHHRSTDTGEQDRATTEHAQV
jgi:hypothetical protein